MYYLCYGDLKIANLAILRLQTGDKMRYNTELGKIKQNSELWSEQENQGKIRIDLEKKK